MRKLGGYNIAPLLAGAVLAGIYQPAQAAKLSPRDTEMQKLEQEVRELEKEVEALKQAQTGNPQPSQLQAQPPTPTQSPVRVDPNRPIQATADQPTGIKVSTPSRTERVPVPRAQDTRASLTDGRPTFATADGKFTASLRGLMQYDVAYFSQKSGAGLNSGNDFRRAQLGITGRVYDWSYNFIYDFGGSGVERPGFIYSAYAEYDGLAPFGFRIGAYAPPAGIEDSTTSADLIFPERAASVDIARNIAGAPSRDSATIFYTSDRFYGALSYTGGKVADAATFDEQQGLVGRASALVYSSSTAHLLLDADASHVFHFSDATQGPGLINTTSFSISPEVGPDSTKLINTGNITASNVTEYGFETAGNWKSAYAQAGYFSYTVGKGTNALPDPSFSGWYVLGTYLITGESRNYNPSIAAFTNPKPTGPWGAWEVAARYSDANLNYRQGLAGQATPIGSIRGGDQKIATAGLNWYPNSVFHFALDYNHIIVGKLTAKGADGGTKADAIILRSQVAF